MCMRDKLFQSALTLCNPEDSSLPGSSVHGILQARVLEWGAIAFSVRVHGPPLSSQDWFWYLWAGVYIENMVLNFCMFEKVDVLGLLYFALHRTSLNRRGWIKSQSATIPEMAAFLQIFSELKLFMRHFKHFLLLVQVLFRIQYIILTYSGCRIFLRTYCAGGGRGWGLREEKNCRQEPYVLHV